MNIYFIKLAVRPSPRNRQFVKAQNIQAYVWIKSYSSDAAIYIAIQETQKDFLDIEELVLPPMIVNREMFLDRKEGLVQFDKANSRGIALLYTVVDKDIAEPLKTDVNRESIDVGSFHTTRNKLAKRGRCLHYESGERCNKYIKAHSIQKSQSLKAIALDNHVYGLANKLTKDGNAFFKKYGVNDFSRFKGFCKFHDDALFKPIDTSPFEPADAEHIALYGYRSICMETFVKENSLELFKSQFKEIPENSPYKKQFSDFQTGTQIGFESLIWNKILFEELLEPKNFSELEYVIFESNSPAIMAFSGLFYPEFDLQGNAIQDLSDTSSKFALMTLSSGPTANGWAIIFAWHKKNTRVCTHFMRSIATVIHDGKKISDILFRIVIATCENLAFSPSWWEKLSSDTQDNICEYSISNASPYLPVPNDYLAKGLEGIVHCNFEKVYSEMGN